MRRYIVSSSNKQGFLWDRFNKQLQIYVTNRNSEIQKTMNARTWNHIATSENPADPLSTGTTNYGDMVQPGYQTARNIGPNQPRTSLTQAPIM